jgi:hypothetical protein
VEQRDACDIHVDKCDACLPKGHPCDTIGQRRTVMTLKAGELVGVPATYTKGPFADELLVSIQIDDESVSGFVRRENVQFIDDTRALVKAKVLSVDTQVVLELYGQFFTTNGIEPVQADWASKNLSVLATA